MLTEKILNLSGNIITEKIFDVNETIRGSHSVYNDS